VRCSSGCVERRSRSSRFGADREAQLSSRLCENSKDGAENGELSIAPPGLIRGWGTFSGGLRAPANFRWPSGPSFRPFGGIITQSVFEWRRSPPGGADLQPKMEPVGGGGRLKSARAGIPVRSPVAHSESLLSRPYLFPPIQYNARSDLRRICPSLSAGEA
jgi:hypothetical protein